MMMEVDGWGLEFRVGVLVMRRRKEERKRY
jgi:hypothetical protein